MRNGGLSLTVHNRLLKIVVTGIGLIALLKIMFDKAEALIREKKPPHK
jgi:hypothetical protein